MKINTRPAHVSLVLLSMVGLQGCVSNLAAVRTFATDTQTLTSTISQTIDDEPKSCMRRLYRDRTIQTDQEDIILKGKKACDDLQNAAKIPQSLNTVMTEYAKTLSALADNQFATYSGELNQIRGALTQVKDGDTLLFKSTDIQASISISNLILQASTEAYRQREIKHLLEKHDDLVKVANTLKQYLNRSYLIALRSERDSIESQLLTLEQKWLKKESVRARELIEDLKLSLETVEKKKQAAQTTVIAIDAMIASHEKLKAALDHLDHSTLLQSMIEYGGIVSSLRNQLKTVSN